MSSVAPPTLAPPPSHRLRLLGLAYGLSGMAFLTLETLWIRSAGLRIGSTVVSATWVVAVYFACAAGGCLAGGRLVKKTDDPLLWYGLSEIACGLSAACLYALQSWLFAPQMPHALFVLLLIGLPSFFSGGAFAALSEAAVMRAGDRTTVGGSVYGGNLLGAALGALGGGLLLPMVWGYGATFYAAAALHLLIGLTAACVLRRMPERAEAGPTPKTDSRSGRQRRDARRKRPVPQSPAPTPPEASPLPSISVGLALAVLVGSGALSLLLEIMAVAYARQMLASSVYTVGAVLFAFIINLGLGSLLASALRRRGGPTARLLALFLAASGALALLYPALCAVLIRAPRHPPDVSPAAFALQVVLAATLVLLPLLVCVGTVFPLAWECLEGSRAHQGEALGRMAALNKIGSALGACVPPFLLLPLLGLPGVVIAAGAAYLLLAAGVAASFLPPRRVLVVAAGLLLVCGPAAYLFRHVPTILAPGEWPLALYQGADGVVAVTEDRAGSHHIILNQTYTLNGTETALLSQKDESWIPLFLVGHPQRVAFVGMASGVSAAAALDFPIQHLDAVEINPEVVQAAHDRFAPWNSPLFTDPRAHVVVNDGRYALQTSPEKFDAVICTLLLPAQEGTSSLYSREFFQSVDARLSERGVFCLWLPAYQMDDELAGIVTHTFLSVFPHAILIRGNLSPQEPIIGLVGSPAPLDLSSQSWSGRLQEPHIRRIAAQCPFFRSEADARLLLVGDLVPTRDSFAAYPINTDDNGVFAFRGPKFIPHGQNLRGFTLLDWMGRRFLSEDYPSCLLDTAAQAQIRPGIRAGNYCYAASVSSAPVPGGLEAQLARDQQAAGYLATAHRLSPQISIAEADLGR